MPPSWLVFANMLLGAALSVWFFRNWPEEELIGAVMPIFFIALAIGFGGAYVELLAWHWLIG